MKKYTTVLLTLLAIVSFVSCDKKNDDDNTPPEKTKTELITASPWKLSTVTANGFNAISAIDPCFRDNIGTFVSTSPGAGTGTITEGATECSPSSAESFTWTFQSNEAVLDMSIPLLPVGTGTFNIQTLTETTLVLQQNMTLPVLGASNVVVTFIH